jgi:hypothetical protein
MKLIIFLLPFWCFGQLNLTEKNNNMPFALDSTIQGDWYLMETMVQPEFSYDSIPVMRFTETGNKRITFTKDSLYIHPWNTRYYKRTERFNYELNGSDIKLFSGIKKKRVQLDQLQIIRFTPEILIINATKELTDPLGSRFLTTQYIYCRNVDCQSKFAAFNGEWIACDNKPINILRDGGESELVFNRDSVCVSGIHQLTINFRSDKFKMTDEVSLTMSTSNSALFVNGIEFFLDSKKFLIYFIGSEIVAYSYEFLDSGELKLVYNQEESERFKTNQKE